MKRIPSSSILFLLLPNTIAFAPTSTTLQRKDSKLFSNNDQYDLPQRVKAAGASFVAAATIFTGAVFSDLAVVGPAAYAAESVVELSRGAIIIETTSTEKQSLVKAEIDSTSLIKTLFTNRKELQGSLTRLQQSVAKELNEPAWLEIQKEILQLEGDVAPSIKVSPPSSWKQAVEDVSKGKLNFLVNGEVVNVAIEPNFGEKQDELVVRVKGFKGERLPSLTGIDTPPAQVYGPITAWIRQFDEFWAFWDEPFPSQVRRRNQTDEGMRYNRPFCSNFSPTLLVFAERRAGHEWRYHSYWSRQYDFVDLCWVIRLLHESNRRRRKSGRGKEGRKRKKGSSQKG